jgi:ABC-type lipoprotein release transport system permease subunit
MSWVATEGVSAVFNSVTPGLFKTLGIPIVMGRDFEWSDHAEATRVAILTRSLASKLFPDRSPLGERIRIGTQPYRQDIQVVGVVADAKPYDVKDNLSYAAYIADLQNSEPTAGGMLVIRGRPDEVALHQAVASAGPDFVVWTEPLTNVFSAALALDRVTALLATIFAGATLLLAAVGVGGLIAYSVALRKKEIAIRVALGGAPKRIARSILREGLEIALFGTALGAIISLAATRPLRPLLFGIGAYDPAVMVGVPLLLAFVVACACLVPAIRAASVDPAIGLRTE